MKARIINKSKFNLNEDKAKKLSLCMIITLLIFVLIFILIIFLNPRSYKVVTYSFNTYVVQTIYGDNAEKTAEEAANTAAEVEDLLGFDGENSEIALINENAGDKWTSLSGLSYNVLEEAKNLSELTGGDYDFTLAPVSRLYRFGEEIFTLPDESLIKEYINKVNYSELRLDSEEKSASFAHFGYAADLTHILMGVACDTIAEVYVSKGIDSAAVIIGDSMGIIGAKPGGEKWEIEVNTPKNESVLGKIRITEGFVSTVSKYENYTEINGIEYHDIIDPKTGYPVRNNLESVTVIANSGIESNALAYAFFVKGYNESIRLAEELDVFIIFVFDDNTVRIHGKTGVFELTNKDYKLR